ncbi:hypothetical protein [Sphaerisporangium perillae]|uniref:hypothetical protein n=1 Tax=Sphaerisporangium perillae TaxID=2935860 RepID=UPI00200BBC81|nr:hypothetical protein [Sphaerisporangium perillae]
MRIPHHASVAALAPVAAAITALSLMQAPACAAVTSTDNAAQVPATSLISAGSAARPLGNAPRCVAVWQKTGSIHKTGYARNDCGYRMNLKIVWAFGKDGSCRTVAPGQTIKHQVPRGPRNFDGASKC